MSKFNVGDKVHVEFDAVVSDVQPNGEFWVKRGHADSLLSDDWAEKILPKLPTAVGSVIRITEWYHTKHDDWTGVLRLGGRWALSADAGVHYGAESMEINIRQGKLDFEVLFDASEATK